jgi:hypothetical protein
MCRDGLNPNMQIIVFKDLFYSCEKYVAIGVNEEIKNSP